MVVVGGGGGGGDKSTSFLLVKNKILTNCLPLESQKFVVTTKWMVIHE